MKVTNPYVCIHAEPIFWPVFVTGAFSLSLALIFCLVWSIHFHPCKNMFSFQPLNNLSCVILINHSDIGFNRGEPS